jgi:Zn-finger nucleic acid-binding protein
MYEKIDKSIEQQSVQRVMATEPCPFCGARIVPIIYGFFKKCPICGGVWYESGGGGRTIKKGYGGGGSGAAEEYATI